MKITKKIQASRDILVESKYVFRIWKGKLRIGEITYREENPEVPISAKVGVTWDDGSVTTTSANFLRYIDPTTDLSKIQELQMLFNEYGIDISNEVKLYDYYLEQTGDVDLADQLSDEAAHYGRQLTSQSWQNVRATSSSQSIQYGSFLIAIDLGGDGYNIYKDGQLWDEGYGSIQKAMQAIDDSGEEGADIVSSQQVSPDAARKGKLITATRSGSLVQAAADITAGDLTDDQFELLLQLRQKAHEVLLSPSFGFPEEDVNDYYFVEGRVVDDAFVVEVRAELDYDNMMELAEALNPLVAAVDSGSYFDMEEPGIMTAYLYQDSITSAQNMWDIPERSLEPKEQPDFRYDMEESIDFEFDLTLTVDDTGYYEYSEESKEDFIGQGPKGEWYGEEYNGTLVPRPEDLEEQLDELIHHMIPGKAGRYRIQGTAHLVYEIEGVSPETEEEVPFNTGDVSFCYEKSSVDDFKWQVVDDATVQSSTVVEPVRRVSSDPLSHGYFLNKYSTGVMQITKPRPYDDAEYWWARYDEARKSWGICKSSMCRKYISEDDIDSLDDIVEELEMLNSIISPKMVHN